ncbi:STAS domain-containing protein [Streptomyces aureus]|uniref:STAS domain-containing protein n=1 Tax=Streptomyces aureus TaxID=193461 RepID=UPI00368A744A
MKQDRDGRPLADGTGAMMVTHAALTADRRYPAPPGTLVIALEGEAHIGTGAVLARALDEALAAPALEVLVVDCSGLTFCAVAGLNELLRARRAAMEAGIAFRLAAPGRQMSRLLDIAGAEPVFDLLPSAPAPTAPSEGPRITVPPGREQPSGAMDAQVAALAALVAQQIRDGLWELSDEESALARATGDRLAEAIGPGAVQERLTGIERLERLRAAIAEIAISLAHTHGRLAWFLARTATALTPVLDWRALTAEDGQSFGTRVPEPRELTDAENAVRRLRTALTGDPDTEAAPAHLGL